MEDEQGQLGCAIFEMLLDYDKVCRSNSKVSIENFSAEAFRCSWPFALISLEIQSLNRTISARSLISVIDSNLSSDAVELRLVWL